MLFKIKLFKKIYGGMMHGKAYKKAIIFILILNMISIKVIYGEETNMDKFLGKTKAIVIDVLSTKEDKRIIKDNKDGSNIEQQVEVLIKTGAHKGEIIVIENIVDYSEAKEFLLHKGDKILISIQERDGKIIKGYLYEFQRDNYLVYLLACCIVLMSIIGRLEGIKSLFTIVLILIFTLGLLPAVIIKGYSSKIVCICILLLVIMAIIIIRGINRGAYASIIGIIFGGTVAGITFRVMSNIARLSEYNNLENQTFTYSLRDININYKELLSLNMLIGIIGVLMNITIVISSAMRETENLNPNIDTLKLMMRGMRAGRKVLGTSIIILILANIAVSFDFIASAFTYKISFMELINQSIIASVIVRILCGAIGVIVSIPITVGTYVICRNKSIN
ncbi:hypothetical protein GOM49_07085 [Clostridium bovifaecis]|uniref:YibE/F family protein n=1 Tax=Clostridium bovifaecis TaxID=2184719 RepID=A0A6I6EVE5_9CLOT|nr:hypothetical protein GOM49_07085 [Clostridium bovifaecis]